MFIISNAKTALSRLAGIRGQKNRAHKHHMVVKVYVHISFELNKISLSFYPELLLQKESSLMISHSVSYNPGIV